MRASMGWRRPSAPWRRASARPWPPFRVAVERLITMPGVSETEARVIVAEVGPDMTRFPPAGRLEDLGLTVEIRPAA